MTADPLVGLDRDFLRFLGATPESQTRIQRGYLPLFAGCRRVVDLGCGGGDFVLLLREQGIDALGVDNDEQAVEDARQRGIPVVQADALEYIRSQPANSVDGIFCAHLVEHLPYPAVMELVHESYRVLRRGGRLAILTPNVRALLNHLDMYYRHFGHVTFYHPDLLKFFLEREGFVSLRAGENPQTASPLLFPLRAEMSRSPSSPPPPQVRRPDGRRYSRLPMVGLPDWNLPQPVPMIPMFDFGAALRVEEGTMGVGSPVGNGQEPLPVELESATLPDFEALAGVDTSDYEIVPGSWWQRLYRRLLLRAIRPFLNQVRERQDRQIALLRSEHEQFRDRQESLRVQQEERVERLRSQHERRMAGLRAEQIRYLQQVLDQVNALAVHVHRTIAATNTSLAEANEGIVRIQHEFAVLRRAVHQVNEIIDRANRNVESANDAAERLDQTFVDLAAGLDSVHRQATQADRLVNVLAEQVLSLDQPFECYVTARKSLGSRHRPVWLGPLPKRRVWKGSWRSIPRRAFRRRVHEPA